MCNAVELTRGPLSINKYHTICCNNGNELWTCKKHHHIFSFVCFSPSLRWQNPICWCQRTNNFHNPKGTLLPIKITFTNLSLFIVFITAAVSFCSLNVTTALYARKRVCWKTLLLYFWFLWLCMRKNWAAYLALWMWPVNIERCEKGMIDSCGDRNFLFGVFGFSLVF